MLAMHDSAAGLRKSHSGTRSGISTLSFVVGSVLWLLVLGAMWFVVGKRADERAQAPDTETSGDPPAEAIQAVPRSAVIIFPSRELPEFEFPECMGGTISRESMRGHRWLASFVFTRCVETCPVITRNVSELHTRVAESNPEFRFVTFSVDSSYDSADVLKKYAETFRADHDRWKFLTGDENTIHDLIRRGFAQFVKPNLGELRKPGFEVAHSNRAVLVNEDCIPVATFLMTDPDQVVKLRRIIDGKDEFPQPGPAMSLKPADGANPSISLNLVPVTDSGSAVDEGSNEAMPDDKANSVPTPNHENTTGAKPNHADPNGAMPDGADPNGGKPNETLDPGGPGNPDSPETDSAAAESEAEGQSAQSRNERIEQKLPLWVARLPATNATLNSICTALLVAGFVSIRAGKRTLHRNLMVSAFLVSVVFLGCYLTYHEALYRFTGERGRAFVGSDRAAILYRSILIPHVILAVFVPILAIRVFVHAWKQRWDNHRRLAKITLPIWLFVSITGVVIYWMLYHWPWRSVPVSMAVVG